MAEVKERKGPDYSETALFLVNPPEILDRLKYLREVQKERDAHEASLSSNPTYKAMQDCDKIIQKTEATLKEMIEEQGSYQDQEAGMYALKYKRSSKEYHPEKFNGDGYDQYRAAVIAEAINQKALEGLIKGGLFTIEQLKSKGVITEKDSFAFYIRAGIEE